jgi:hypothetical protein
MGDGTPTKQQLAAIQTIANLRSPDVPLSPADSAEYSKALLVSLRKIADAQGHRLLSHLLNLAAQEAQAIAERSQADDKNKG